MTERLAPPSIPGWKILGRIGSGGMADVWRARRADGTVAAIKVQRAETSHGETGTESLFRRESLACLNVDHPNLVRAFDAGTTAEGRPYLALEFVPGETLDAAVKRQGALPEANVVAIGLALARALDHAHRLGLVHRDVKPRNVMLTPDGGVKLLDLGLVVETAEGAATHEFGTFGFTAPEILAGGADTPRADLFSLGVTLAGAATGKLPTKERGFADRSMSEIGGARTSPGLGSVLERLMKSDPASRYGSAAELVLDFESLAAGERPLGAILGSGGAAVMRRGPRVAVIGGLVVLAAGGVAWIATRPAPPPPPPPETASAPPPAAAPVVDDPNLAAARLFLERYPADFVRGREMLNAADTPSLTADARDELASLRGTLDRRFDAAARRTLEELTSKAEEARLAGDVARAHDTLAAWPEALRDAPQAAEAAKRAETVLVDARAEAEALFTSAKLEDSEPSDGAAELVAQLDTAIARPRFDGDRHEELARLRSFLQQRFIRLAQEREYQASEGALQSAFARHFRDPSAARLKEALDVAAGNRKFAPSLDNAAQVAQQQLMLAEERLRARLATLVGRVWCGPNGAELQMGTCRTAPDAREVFLSPLWPTSHARVDALVQATGARELAVIWLVANGAFADTDRIWSTADPLAILLGGMQVGLAARGSVPVQFSPRSAFALRSPGEPVDGPSANDAVLSAWKLVITGARPKSPPRDPAAPAAKSKGLDAFLADDLPAAWSNLTDAERLDPWDAEIAALRGRVALLGARTLPTLPAELEAFAEARRAWDLDPTLAAGPALVAEAGIELLAMAGPDLAMRVRPIVAAACQAADGMGRSDARMLAFAGEWELSEGHTTAALQLLRRASSKDTASANVAILLARAEHAAGHDDKAKDALRRARTLAGGQLPASALDLADALGE